MSDSITAIEFKKVTNQSFRIADLKDGCSIIVGHLSLYGNQNRARITVYGPRNEWGQRSGIGSADVHSFSAALDIAQAISAAHDESTK